MTYSITNGKRDTVDNMTQRRTRIQRNLITFFFYFVHGLGFFFLAFLLFIVP